MDTKGNRTGVKTNLTQMNIIDAYIYENINHICNLAMEICQIPSMTGHEEKKAVYIKSKLMEICGKEASIDEAGNVLYMHNAIGSDRISVYAAHIDTVFSNIQDFIPLIRGNTIYAPSIWDNSINIAALIFLIRMIEKLGISLNRNILFAFDVGEEGFGNLKGIRHIVDSRKNVIDEVIALDLGYNSVINTAVGSKRYSVSLKTQGGHSWNDFGNGNAIAKAAEIINELYRLKVPMSPKTTYNVGIIKGGTSVNTIAEAAEINIDLRSEDEKCLLELENIFLKILEGIQDQNTKIQYHLLGERPCGNIPPDSNLQKRIIETRQELGLKPEFGAGSTDANIPLSLGIPAVSFGVCNGGGAHTMEEFIEANTLETGMKHLAYFMLKD